MKKSFQILFILILALFSLGQLQRIQLTKVSAFYIHDVILAIWLCFSWVKYSKKWKKIIYKIINNQLFLFSAGWILLGLIISIITTGLSLAPLLYILRALTYALFGLSFTFIKPFSQEKQRNLWILSGLLITVWGLIQYFLLPDTRFLKYLGWDDHYFRLISTQFDPNFTGIIIVLTLILTQSIKIKPRWIKILTSLFLSLSILLTYSRASFLSFLGGLSIIGLITYLKSHKINKLLLTIIGLFIIGLPLLPRPAGEGVKLERTASISSRVESNSSALKDLKSYQWITGKGLFTLSESPKNNSILNDTAHFPDNLFIFFLSSVGLIGLSLSIFILYKFGHYLYQKDIFIFSAFIAILIHAQFNHTLFQPFIWLWLSSLGFSLKGTKT